MIKTDDGEIPLGVLRFKQIVENSYYITKATHTTYSDVLDMSVNERDKFLELIAAENKKRQEQLDKAKRKKGMQ